jgi:predicted DNA-binding mobile mystery protein A
MPSATTQLDRRFAEMRPFTARAARPPRGWIRALREALGMTTAQLARRMGVKQPRVTELEKAEVAGAVTLQTLERAAEALGCRLVYALVPHHPLDKTLRARAAVAAEAHLAAIEQSMRLEAQGVDQKGERQRLRSKLVEDMLKRPARLWDGP